MLKRLSFYVIGSLSSYVWQSLLLVLIDDEPEIKYLASEIVVDIKLKSEAGIFLFAFENYLC